jgi:hypothetical protein
VVLRLGPHAEAVELDQRRIGAAEIVDVGEQEPAEGEREEQPAVVGDPARNRRPERLAGLLVGHPPVGHDLRDGDRHAVALPHHDALRAGKAQDVAAVEHRRRRADRRPRRAGAQLVEDVQRHRDRGPLGGAHEAGLLERLPGDRVEQDEGVGGGQSQTLGPALLHPRVRQRRGDGPGDHRRRGHDDPVLVGHGVDAADPLRRAAGPGAEVEDRRGAGVEGGDAEDALEGCHRALADVPVEDPVRRADVERGLEREDGIVGRPPP